MQKDVKQRLGQAILRLKENPRPRGYIQLKGQRDIFYRIRVGEWRIIYTIKDDVLLVVVVEIGQRKDIYEGY